MTPQAQKNLLVSRGWLHAAILIYVVGFFVMGLLAYRIQVGQPPVPNQVIDQEGNVIFTASDIMAGQKVFPSRGLMEYGSIFGHGGYLGPDYTADYLRRASEFVMAAGDGMVLLGNGRTVRRSGAGRRRIPALPCRDR
jgi:nitric oxide reductase subunit B